MQTFRSACARTFLGLAIGCSTLGQQPLWAQPGAEPVPPPAPTLPETNVTAEQQQGSPQGMTQSPPADTSFLQGGSALDGTIFTSQPVTGYLAEETTTGTLINIPDLGLPATVNAITHDTIIDQQALRVTDLYRDAGAVVPVGDTIFGDRIYIRGQEISSRDFRKNGFFDPSLARRDLANVQRVEIFKGPTSVIYGAGQPGGLVNLITKTPVDGRFSTFSVQGGSFDLQRYTIDDNGSINESGSLRYRINAAYEEANSFRDFIDNERTFVNPVVTWVIDSDTTLTWSGEYFQENRRPDSGIPAIGTNPLALPISRYVGDPHNDFYRQQEYRNQLWLNHKFNEDWALFVGGSSMFLDNPQSLTSTAGPASPGSTLFNRVRQNFEDKEQAQSGMVNLFGDVVDGFGFDHKLVVGTEQVYYDAISSIEGLAVNATNFNPFDVANPDYSPTTPLATAYTFDAPVFRQERHGYYLQDYISLDEHWQVLAGVRFDQTHFVYQRDLGQGSIRNDEHYSRTIPRIGMVYAPLPDQLSYYWNYSQSFNAPTGSLGFTAAPARPEIGESWEGGIKARLLDNLILNVAGFHISRENVPFAGLQFDPQSPFPIPTFTQVGRQRSQGVDLNLIGNLSDRWSLIGNYAYVDTELTDPDPQAGFFGQPQINVPLNSGSVWTRYNFIQNNLRTVGAALGVVCLGERLGTKDGSVLLPAFARWDMGLYYTQGRLNGSVYIENLFDDEYAVSSTNASTAALAQIFPGAPINARAMVWVTF